MSWERSKGLTLGAVILVALLVCCLGFALAGLSTSHLHLTSRRAAAQTASNQASSLVQVALARIISQPDYGSHGEVLNSQEGARLTFASSPDQVYSTNNLEGSGAVMGWNGRTVPLEGVHLVAQSEVRGVRRRVEALYTVPAFPYAVASTAAVVTEGRVLVGAVESAGDIARLEERLLPGDMVSNSTGSPAVRLGAGAQISGNLSAVGQIELDSGAVVDGQVESGADAAAVPSMDLRRYDPQGRSATLSLGPTGELRHPLTGLFRHRGDLQLSGALHLDNGLLYVDGDLTVNLDSSGRGGLHGVGALVVTGRTTIHGGSQFREENGVALLSGQDVRLLGGHRESSFLQGMIYSEGTVEASDLTLLGSVIVNSDEPRPIRFREARAIYLSEMTDIEIPEPFQFTHRVVTPGEGHAGTITDSYDITASYDPRSGNLVLYSTGGVLEEPTHYIFGNVDEVVSFPFSNPDPEPVVLELTPETAGDRALSGQQISVTVPHVQFNVPDRTPELTGRSRTITVELTRTRGLGDYIDRLQRVESQVTRYDFDPNRFLELSQKIRPVFWKED